MDFQRSNVYEPLQQYNAAHYFQGPILPSDKTATYTYETYVENPIKHTLVRKQGSFSGWRFGVSLFSTAALLVLVANIGIAVYCIRQYGGSITADFKPVFTGNCDKTKQLNTWTHLTINILSSILLSGSNFSMQVLTTPTRKQIETAHGQRRWLDIGIPSIKNLGSMGHGRRSLWVFLMLTSVPLHLVYNSVFSQSWTRQAYEAALVTEDFLKGAAFDAGYTEPSPTDPDQRRLFAEIQKNSSTYQRLDVVDCIKAYNKKAVIDRKTVLVVTSSPRPISNKTYSFSPPVVLGDGTPNPIYATDDFVGNEVATSTWTWMCPETDTYTAPECSLKDVLAGKAEWSPFYSGVKVDYCLSEYLGEQCTLDFSFGLMMTVCICNLVKLICMVVLYFSRSHSPLLNIGDAVSSFLNVPDSTTIGICLAGKEQINKTWAKKAYTPINNSQTWMVRSWRWFKACSVWRWVIFTLLSLALILISAGLLAIGLRDPRASSRDSAAEKPWWKSGFGAANIDEGSKYAITYGHELYQPNRLVANILLANLPQLAISFLFLLYNGILTAMLMAKEWSEFAHVRKTLRVTAPSGQQRSTYYLQLPYRYAIPLLVTSMLLHWLTSQAIFLDRRIVQQVWWNEPYTDNTVGSVSTVGYSPLAVMLCLVLGLIMVIALLVMGFRKYKPGIPLASSCSAAISAACHAPVSANDASVLPLLWGVVGMEQWGGVGHCALSSGEVSMPQPGARYAGF